MKQGKKPRKAKGDKPRKPRIPSKIIVSPKTHFQRKKLGIAATPPGYKRVLSISLNPILIASGIAAGVATGAAITRHLIKKKSDIDSQIEKEKKNYETCSEELKRLQNAKNNKATQTVPYILRIGGFWNKVTKEDKEGKKLATLNYYQNLVKECQYQIEQLKGNS